MSAGVFRATLEMLEDPVLITSGETPGDSRVLFCNPALTALCGFALEEILGLPITAALVEDAWLADPLWSNQPSTGAERRPYCLGEATMPIKRQGAAMALARWRVDFRPEQLADGHFGAGSFYVMRVRLVSAQDTVETAVISRLLSEIRHELGNPINSIEAALTLIRRGSGVMPPEKLTNYLDAVFSELDRMERLLESLRRLGDKPSIRPVLVGLRQEITTLLAGKIPELATAGIELVLEPGLDRIPVWLDRAAFKQVVESLVKNAVEALAGVDQPEIKARVVAAGQYALFQLTDNGSGIGETAKPWIFDPLFTTKKGAGGLGLAIARRLMTMMEGAICLDSAPGRGTTVTVSLPFAGPTDDAG